jgi:SAM-dependent methyltransferase
MRGSAEALPLPDAAADAVLFLNSLHHVGDLDAALAEAARVLRPGGVVYVQEPLAEGDYFELVRLVDDETGVRAAAQAAVRRHASPGAGAAPLLLVHEEEYDARVVHRDMAGFHARVVLADERRAAAFAHCGADVAARFAEVGRPGPDGVEFRQPTRVTLLRRVAGAPGDALAVDPGPRAVDPLPVDADAHR